MELTSKNVEAVIMDCFFPPEMDEEEAKKVAVFAEGVLGKFGFDPKKLKKRKDDIISMLMQLPKNFHRTSGGGWSFLNAVNREDGTHWGEHRDVEALLVLGIAVGHAKFQMPREMWSILPGGMPYFVVWEKAEDEKTQWEKEERADDKGS